MKRSRGLLLMILLTAGGLGIYLHRERFGWLPAHGVDRRGEGGIPDPGRGRVVEQASAGPPAAGARPPGWTPKRAPIPPAPGEPMRIQARPDGTFVLRTPGGSELPPLSAEQTQQLADSIQAALLESSLKHPGGPSWSPGQSAGPPDTTDHADRPTAWASEEPDAGPEWLRVEFERAVEISEITIHESFNPGALSKIIALLPDGSETVIWEGTTPAEQSSVERALKVPPGIRSHQIRLELDTRRVPGWNEIDAVEIIGSDGSHQWAREATASSYFGQNRSVRILKTRS